MKEREKLRFDKRTDPLLEDIAANIRKCIRCQLAEGRMNAVPGEGPQHSKMMFVGEAPGAKEDETGRPFIGQSGNLLSDIMKESGIDRSEVFVTSVLKCRPPENRNPRSEEVKACAPYLISQMDSISPVVIVTLGNAAYDLFASTFYLPKKKIGEVRGKVFRLHSTGARVLVPTYHPAGVIYNRKLISDLKEDLETAIDCLRMNP
jgi:DNA polymerase